jgi:hypothetical protein
MMNFFRRFPVALVQGTVVPILIALVPVLGLTAEQTGAVDTVLLALGGVVAAFGVAVDAGLPLLAGLGKATLAAVFTFGVHVPEAWSTAGLAVLSMLVAAWIHGAVTAKQPAKVIPLLPRSTAGGGRVAA